MESFNTRLQQERKRLKLTQEALGAIGGVESNAQTSYETGKRWPRADYLQRVSLAGVDITYLMTGERNQLAAPPVATAPAPTQTASVNEAAPMVSALIASLGQNLRLTASTIAAITNTESLTKRAREDIAEGLRDFHSESDRFTTLACSLCRPVQRDR